MSHHIIREGKKLHTIYIIGINHSEKKITPLIYHIDTYTYNLKKLIKLAKHTIKTRKELSKYYRNKGYRFIMYTEYVEASDSYKYVEENYKYRKEL